MSSQKPLKGKICLVTGASRGIGKGVALELGFAGATVYITGRTLKPTSSDSVVGSLQETADQIQASGGVAIPVECDHKDEVSTVALFERIRREQQGKLDLVVNNAYSAVNAIMSNMGKPFWETGIQLWDEVNNVGLRNYYHCSCEAAKIMVERKKSDPTFTGGMIINISSAGGLEYIFNVPYGVGKDAVDRMAMDMAQELKPFGIAAISLWPGAVTTEEIQHHVINNPDSKMKKTFANGESPQFVGRVVVALMKDPNVYASYNGKIVFTAETAANYGIVDIDNRQIPSMRSLKFLLHHFGWHRLAGLVPAFVKVPYTLLALRFRQF